MDITWWWKTTGRMKTARYTLFSRTDSRSIRRGEDGLRSPWKTEETFRVAYLVEVFAGSKKWWGMHWLKGSSFASLIALRGWVVSIFLITTRGRIWELQLIYLQLRYPRIGCVYLFLTCSSAHCINWFQLSACSRFTERWEELCPKEARTVGR